MILSYPCNASVTVVLHSDCTKEPNVFRFALKGGGVTCMKAVQWVQYKLCYDCVGALEVASRGPIQGSGLLNDGI